MEKCKQKKQIILKNNNDCIIIQLIGKKQLQRLLYID